MAGLDILNNGLRSLTGAVTKAYIKFEDERISANDVNVTEVRARAAALPPGIPGADKLMAAAQKALFMPQDTITMARYAHNILPVTPKMAK